LKNNEAAVTYMSNSIAQNATGLIQYSTNTFISNSLHTSKSTQSSSMILLAGQKVDVRNSVFHFKFSGEGGAFVTADTSCRVTSLYNIYVIESTSSDYITLARANTYGGAGTGPDIHDYNAYIWIGGTPRWMVTDWATNGGDPYITSFSIWKVQSGQDAHSIMIDLRGNPNGLNQIFVNPEAGDFRLASTPQADSIRAIAAGMSTPLRTFVTAPTREQAVEDIEQNRFTPVRNLFIPTPGPRRRIGNLNITDQ
jgi:hypothetical protein